jgi:hypothetical protein
MPQSLSVFAVSLQEHPELLVIILPLLRLNVKGYYMMVREVIFMTQPRVLTFQHSAFSGHRFSRLLFCYS